jgi:hypothetical protein
MMLQPMYCAYVHRSTAVVAQPPTAKHCLRLQEQTNTATSQSCSHVFQRCLYLCNRTRQPTQKKRACYSLCIVVNHYSRTPYWASQLPPTTTLQASCNTLRVRAIVAIHRHASAGESIGQYGKQAYTHPLNLVLRIGTANNKVAMPAHDMKLFFAGLA